MFSILSENGPLELGRLLAIGQELLTPISRLFPAMKKTEVLTFGRLQKFSCPSSSGGMLRNYTDCTLSLLQGGITELDTLELMALLIGPVGLLLDGLA